MKPETITEKLRRNKEIDNDFDYRRAQIRHQRLETIDSMGMTQAEVNEYEMLDECLYAFEKKHCGPFV